MFTERPVQECYHGLLKKYIQCMGNDQNVYQWGDREINYDMVIQWNTTHQ